MKHYYAFKVLLLNILSAVLRKIGLQRLPLSILDWFIKRYLYNLSELAKRLEDNETLQKIEFVGYEYEKRK